MKFWKTLLASFALIGSAQALDFGTLPTGADELCYGVIPGSPAACSFSYADLRARSGSAGTKVIVTSPEVTGVGTSASPENFVEGHYTNAKNGDVWDLNAATDIQNRRDRIDEAAANPGLVGVKFSTTLGHITDFATTDPNGNLANLQFMIDTLDYAESQNVKVVWQIYPQQNGSGAATWCPADGTAGSPTYYPPYFYPLFGNGNVCSLTNTNASILQFWRTDVQDEYIEILQALAAGLDGHPALSGFIVNRETATGGDPPEPSYNVTDYNDGMMRIALAAKAAFVNTPIIMYANFRIGNGTQTAFNAFAQEMSDNEIALGAPDLAPDCLDPSPDKDCPAGFADPQTGVNGSPYLAYNARKNGSHSHMCAWQLEASQLGNNAVGQSGGYSATALFNFADQYLNCHIVFWDRNLTSGDPDQQWFGAGGLLETLNANALSNTTNPFGSSTSTPVSPEDYAVFAWYATEPTGAGDDGLNTISAANGWWLRGPMVNSLADTQYTPQTRTNATWQQGYCPYVPVQFSTTYSVNSQPSLSNALNQVQPGEAIIILDGVYDWDSSTILSTSGTESNRVYVLAESLYGAEFITSAGGFDINGDWIVWAGFKATNDTAHPFVHMIGNDNRAACNWFLDPVAGSSMWTDGLRNEWDNNIHDGIVATNRAYTVHVTAKTDTIPAPGSFAHIHHNEWKNAPDVSQATSMEAIIIGFNAPNNGNTHDLSLIHI